MALPVLHRNAFLVICLSSLSLTACGNLALTAADSATRPVSDTPSAQDSNTSSDATQSPPAPSDNPNDQPAQNTLGKRGFASGEQVLPALSPQDLAALSPNTSWWYNWTYKPASQALADASQKLGLEYVPMVFTAPFDANAIIASILPGTRYLLTFNEPNFSQQANLTPLQAAQAWPEIERIAQAHNLKIVSPALNYCGGACNETSPTAWLDAFFAACPNCRVDYLALHAYVCYGNALTGAYLDPFYKKYNKRIWLTEFSCLDGSAPASDMNTQLRYLQESVTLMEQDPRVMRYAWFIARTGPNSAPIGLLSSPGALTALGTTYVSLPSSPSSTPSSP